MVARPCIFMRKTSMAPMLRSLSCVANKYVQYAAYTSAKQSFRKDSGIFG